MSDIEQFLNRKLEQRRADHSIRKLSTHFPPVDFCSNDYLGFAQWDKLRLLAESKINDLGRTTNGSGGSRLLSGNTTFTEEVEACIADFHGAENGLIFNSGYDANVGLFSSVPQRGDTIITDELIHASIIDGCRMSYADRQRFEHNDLSSLESKLKTAKGKIFVAVESVYSMDGDCAPLKEILSLCEMYNANLIVDEAHATGVFGQRGKGLVNQFGLADRVFATIVTFGKALGSHGAIVLGSNALRDFLINFARSFIYTTAAPLHNIALVWAAYQLLPEIDQTVIHQKIALFKKLANENNLQLMESNSTIQGIVFSSNSETKAAAEHLQSSGFDVRAILSPTVPVGKERLRICMHSYNLDNEIASLVKHLKEIK